ncbi:MAG: ATP synthase F1 subunit gamma [Tenacibaculum sp.]
MANLKEIRKRIASIKSTMQITSAMKMVSAAKLKKAQDAVTAVLPYWSKLSNLLQKLSTTGEKNEEVDLFFTQRPINKILLVSITSNRGLCGGFNTSIVKKTAKIINERYKHASVHLLTIGKKGDDILSKEFYIVENRNDIFDQLTIDNVSKLADKLKDLYISKTYDKIEIIYNNFKNAATHITQVEQFLPVKFIDKPILKPFESIFEPLKEEIVLDLIPKLLKIQLYKAIRNSFAAEHGARMTAMHKATDNAKELRDDLLLTYNKARQAAITNEILEIVGGAEALNK